MNILQQAAEAVKSQIADAAPRARISARQTADGWVWEYSPSAGLTRTSRDAYETEAEALYTASIGKSTDRITIQASSAAKASLIARWRMDGIELARRGFDPGYCENSIVWQGWASVARPAGIPVFGWPQPATMEAA